MTGGDMTVKEEYVAIAARTGENVGSNGRGISVCRRTVGKVQHGRWKTLPTLLEPFVNNIPHELEACAHLGPPSEDWINPNGKSNMLFDKVSIAGVNFFRAIF
jgi:hypothetical protein